MMSGNAASQTYLDSSTLAPNRNSSLYGAAGHDYAALNPVILDGEQHMYVGTLPIAGLWLTCRP